MIRKAFPFLCSWIWKPPLKGEEVWRGPAGSRTSSVFLRDKPAQVSLNVFTVEVAQSARRFWDVKIKKFESSSFWLWRCGGKETDLPPGWWLFQRAAVNAVREEVSSYTAGLCDGIIKKKKKKKNTADCTLEGILFRNLPLTRWDFATFT